MLVVEKVKTPGSQVLSRCLKVKGPFGCRPHHNCSCLSCPDHSQVLKDLAIRTYPSSPSYTGGR